MNRPCGEGWEALRGDPIPRLLNDERPGVRARVLTGIMGRPPNSPAVRRARSGANAAEPVAGLLADLWPDGTWQGRVPRWHPAGEGWRLVEAVAWGADPTCPRLQAGWRLALGGLRQDGGWRTSGSDGAPSTAFTARILESCAPVLGWRSDLRIGEAAAWLEEVPSWDLPAVTGAAVLAALRGADGRRPRLRDRAVAALVDALEGGAISARLGFPNRRRTDLAEVLCGLALSGIPYDPVMHSGLRRLQRVQKPGGPWGEGDADPRSPELPVTTGAVVALLRYAVEAGLPRMFPERPTTPRPAVS